MAQTVIRGTQILNNTVQRQDLDTSTVGQAVVTKIVQGGGITLSSTGADSGTGDVTVAATPGVASPVVLGETATDAYFTSGIVVPKYKNYPDAIWTYGAFDDHFDNPASGTPNAKWVHNLSSGMGGVTFTQAGSLLTLAGFNPNPSTAIFENSVTQQLPVQATHTITLEVEFSGFAFSTSGTSLTALLLSIEYGLSAGGLQVQFNILQTNSVPTAQLPVFIGASFGSLLYNYRLLYVPRYWQFVYDVNGSTLIYLSQNGVSWMLLTSASSSQTGFATNAPSQFRMGIQSTYQSPALAQFDWIKHI